MKYKQPYPSHFRSQNCLCGQPAKWWVMVDRLSRSNNVRQMTTGPYCDQCADKKVKVK